MTSFEPSNEWSDEQYLEYFGPEDDPDDEGFELLAIEEVDVLEIDDSEDGGTP